MVLTLFLLLPTTICLFWVLIHFAVASRTDTFKLLAALLTVCGIYIFSEACHALLGPDSKTNMIATLAAQLAGPSLVPLVISYLRRLNHPKRDNPLTYLWIVIPAALFTAGILLYYLKDIPKADELFIIFTETVFYAVIAFELLVLIVMMTIVIVKKKPSPAQYFKFLFKGGEISLSYLQSTIIIIPAIVFILRVAFMHNLYTLDRWVVIIMITILSIIIFAFGLFALMGGKSTVRLSDVKRIMRYNYNQKNKAEAVEAMLDDLLDEAEGEALIRIQEKIGENLHIDEFKGGDLSGEDGHRLANSIFSAVADSWDEDSLTSRFQHLMMDEQLFLQPKLTLDDVADRLCSNKTYVSRMVNNAYNLGFPELINTLRVDYAEQYILSHREAKQDQIAENCGFLSASSFNTIFKKVTGMTPKVWIASLDRQQEKA